MDRILAPAQNYAAQSLALAMQGVDLHYDAVGLQPGSAERLAGTVAYMTILKAFATQRLEALRTQVPQVFTFIDNAEAAAAKRYEPKPPTDEQATKPSLVVASR